MRGGAIAKMMIGGGSWLLRDQCVNDPEALFVGAWIVKRVVAGVEGGNDVSLEEKKGVQRG